jgi:hypothetical protein
MELKRVKTGLTRWQVGRARFKLFFEIQTQFKLVNSKWKTSIAPKIFKLFMGLDLNILNNIQNWVDFKFWIEFMTKILEHISIWIFYEF